MGRQGEGETGRGGTNFARSRNLALLLLLLIALLGYWFVNQSTLFRRDRTWEAMQSRGTWRVAIDPSFPPFEQLDEQNRVVGYDVDLAEAIARTWGLQLEIVPTGFDSLIDALRAGQVDSVISALPFDPRLTRDVAYSESYFDAGIMFVVRADSPLQNADELAAGTIAVELGSAGDVIARQWQREKPALTVQRFETPEDAIAALQNDPKIDGLLIDNVSLRIAQGQGAAIKSMGGALESNPYVIAVPVGAFDLQSNLEEAILSLRTTNGFKTIEDKWFGKGEIKP